MIFEALILIKSCIFARLTLKKGWYYGREPKKPFKVYWLEFSLKRGIILSTETSEDETP